MATDTDDIVSFGDEPKPQRARRRRRGLIVLVSCLAVLGLALGAVGFYTLRGVTALNSIERDPDLNLNPQPTQPVETGPTTNGATGAPTVEPSVTPVAPIVNDSVNFMLMGIDDGQGGTGRSDSLMLAHLSGDRKSLTVISFPRDLWVPIPGHKVGKINWAYHFGGTPLAAQTLEQLVGVQIDHAARVNFDSFVSLTDSLGGVTVYNPWASTVGDERFDKGEITVSGERALAYVRQRHGLPNGDLDRAYRQRSVVKAIVVKATQPEVIANPVLFNDVVSTFAKAVQVDESLTTGKVAELAASLRFSGRGSIQLVQAPVRGFAMIGSQAATLMDEAGMAELAKALQTDTMSDYLSTHQDRYYDKELDRVDQ